MTFIDALEKTISQWRNPENQDEWLFADFTENEIFVLSTSEAFLLIIETVPVLVNSDNSDIWIELFELVICLASQSETTEIPSLLFLNWKSIKNTALNLGEYSLNRFNELSKYYRINC